MRNKRSIVICLVITLVMTMCFTSVNSFAGVSTSSSKTYSFLSNNLSSDYVKVDVNKDKVTVSGKTLSSKKYFRVIIRNSRDAKSAYWGPERKIKNHKFSFTFSTKSIKSSNAKGYKGDIVIKMASKPGKYKSGYDFEGVQINYKSKSAPYLLKYNGIMKQNSNVMQTAASMDPNAYLDATMATEDSQDGGALRLTSYQAQKVKKWSDRICQGATTDYKKLLKIYQYITRNVYYNWYGFAKNAPTEYNPYKLMYAIEDGKSTTKAKTVCDGYSGLMMALGRAQGIPVRSVAGHAISRPVDLWYKTKTSVIDHVWVEAYVEGKWITIDATRGTDSVYYNPKYKPSKSKLKTYYYKGICRYNDFDMTNKGLANSKLYISYRGGPYSIQYMTNPSEIAQLRALFDSDNGAGLTNGQAFNSNYNSADTSTWVATGAHRLSPTGRISMLTFQGPGYGSPMRLAGEMNLSGFKELQVLTSYNGGLTSVNLAGCTSLNKVSLNRNSITSLDLTASRQLKVLSFTYNPAKTIKFRNKSGSIVTINASGNGTIGVKYSASSNEMELTSGTQGVIKGVYNSAGKKVSSGSYKTKGPSGTYTVKFQ